MLCVHRLELELEEGREGREGKEEGGQGRSFMLDWCTETKHKHIYISHWVTQTISPGGPLANSNSYFGMDGEPRRLPLIVQ